MASGCARPSYPYAKAGVILLDLQPAGDRQGVLALTWIVQDSAVREVWAMKQPLRSPRDTTRWDELATVIAL